jgi:hypothetical protein
MVRAAFGDHTVLTRIIPAALAIVISAGGVAAQSFDPFVHSVPLRDSTAQVTVTFHADKAQMVACTPEQVAWIGERSKEHLTEMLPALEARLFSRHDGPGTQVNVELDAACYEGGFMGLGGFARGDEQIFLAYEESLLGGEWGPAPNEPTPQ